MKKIVYKFSLLLVLLIAIITRFYMLGDAPAGVYLDEASQGYSAYSILLTGKDEFGKSFPVVFRSFTDFKTPVYTYLIVPFISVFGLSKFSIRLPSFVLSILTLIFTYLLLNKISPKNLAKPVSFLTTLLLAISPWHILFGRTAFKCNIALFFLIAGLYFFYKGLEKPVLLITSALFLSVSLITYHAYRIIVPLLGLLLVIRFKKTLFYNKHIRFSLLGALAAFIILLPTISIINTPGFMARATGLNIFSPEKLTTSGRITEVPKIFDPIINNNIFLATKEFASLYVAYFSPRNLFYLGDYDKRTSFPQLATFFTWQFPFYLIGFYKLIKDKNLKELRFLTLTLLIISPFPAALTRDPYSTIRSLQMVIPLLIIISLGILKVWTEIRNRYLKILAISAFVFTIVYSLGKLYSSGIILNEYYRAREWNYGWEEVAEFIKSKDQQSQFIIDTARQGPYIELAFFLKYDPVEFQKNNFEVEPDAYYTKMERRSNWNLGNVSIQAIDWGDVLNNKQFLIGDALAISDEQIKNHNLTLVKDILFPNKENAFRIVETYP